MALPEWQSGRDARPLKTAWEWIAGYGLLAACLLLANGCDLTSSSRTESSGDMRVTVRQIVPNGDTIRIRLQIAGKEESADITDISDTATLTVTGIEAGPQNYSLTYTSLNHKVTVALFQGPVTVFAGETVTVSFNEEEIETATECPDCETDGDGSYNWDEVRKGFDPKDPTLIWGWGRWDKARWR